MIDEGALNEIANLDRIVRLTLKRDGSIIDARFAQREELGMSVKLGRLTRAIIKMDAAFMPVAQRIPRDRVERRDACACADEHELLPLIHFGAIMHLAERALDADHRAFF